MPLLGWKLFGLNCLYFKPEYDKCDNHFFVGCTALKENKILVFLYNEVNVCKIAKIKIKPDKYFMPWKRFSINNKKGSINLYYFLYI